MMCRALSLRTTCVAIVGVFLAASVTMAQEAKPTVKPVSDTMKFSSVMKVGDKTLRAAEYTLTGDGTTLVFQESTNRNHEAQTFTFQPKTTPLSAPAKQTQISTSAGPDGSQIVRSVVLKGSSVEYDF